MLKEHDPVFTGHILEDRVKELGVDSAPFRRQLLFHKGKEQRPVDATVADRIGEGCMAENIVEIGRVGNGSKRSTLKVRVYLYTWTCFGGQAKEEPRLAHSLCWHRSAETRDDTLIQARG